MGTLKTYTETRFNWGSRNSGPGVHNGDPGYADFGDQGTSLNFAWIQLGGLRVGKDESAFNTFSGYAGNVINDTIVPYGNFDTNVVQYYFDGGNGFSAVASLETGQGGGANGFGSGSDSVDDYIPYVVGGLKYTQGWGAITGVAAYDSSAEEWAIKGRLDVTPMQNLSLFLMAGYGSDDHSARNYYKQWGGNWAVWGGGTYTINEKTSFNLQVSYDEKEEAGVAANIAYDIVPGFTVTAEVDYAHNKHNSNGFNWTGIPTDRKNAVGGVLRFQRSF
jgi:hypothetical protein